MSVAKILISLPDELNEKFKAIVPTRQRSSVIQHLIENEIKKRERKLYECACAVELDETLNHEMEDWSVTLNDGIKKDESW